MMRVDKDCIALFHQGWSVASVAIPGDNYRHLMRRSNSRSGRDSTEVESGRDLCSKQDVIHLK